MHFPYAHLGSYFTVYREGDWKLIYYYHPKAPEQSKTVLYNLKKDPIEKEDVSTSYSDKLKAMLCKMTRQLQEEGALYPVDKQGHELKPLI